MKISGFILLFSVSLFLFSCCAGNKVKKDMNYKQEAKKKDSLSEKQKIVGTWQGASGKIWFDFKNDGTYQMGKNDSLLVDNKAWTVDENTSRLRLITRKDKVQYVEYSFDGEQLLLKLGKKQKIHKLHRIKTKPVTK